MKRKVGALEKIEADHAALRFKIKRDPQSYRDDFSNQWQQYETLRDLFLQNPSTQGTGLSDLKDLVEFVSHVADLYPDLTGGFANDLQQILLQHHAVLDVEVVGDRGRLADAEVDEGAGGDVAGHQGGHLGLGEAHTATTLSTKSDGVTTASGSSSPVSTIAVTWAITDVAAVAITGPKLRAVLR